MLRASSRGLQLITCKLIFFTRDCAFMTRNIALKAMSHANKISLRVKSEEACAWSDMVWGKKRWVLLSLWKKGISLEKQAIAYILKAIFFFEIRDFAFMTRNIALKAMSLANKISLWVKSDEACAWSDMVWGKKRWVLLSLWKKGISLEKQAIAYILKAILCLGYIRKCLYHLHCPFF